MEVSCLLLPVLVEVVVLDGAGTGVNDDRVGPAGQLDHQPGRLPTVELGRALHRSRQAEPLARSGDRGDVADFGLDTDIMWLTT